MVHEEEEHNIPGGYADWRLLEMQPNLAFPGETNSSLYSESAMRTRIFCGAAWFLR